MFAKVHPAEDVKSGNTGSCHDLVRYLEKETGEGQRFFSHTEQDISPERVIMDIDGNKKALGANDAKFFMLSLNPSQSEQMHLIGRKVDDFKELTPQEKKEVFQKLEAFVYEIGEKRPEKKANVILTDNIIPAGERDQVMSRVYNAKRGIFNKGIVRNKIVFSVNNLHIYDNLLLFTFEIENKSKLPYDIDYIRYYIIDKKTAKLTASQEVDQQALFSENYSPRIEGNGRMKYVIAFDKFTIPDEKVFRIEINEKNGGRHVLFDLENSDIVNVEDI